MPKQPKIALLIPRLGIVDRGAESFVYELAKRLTAFFEVTVFIIKNKKGSVLINELKQKGVKIIPVRCISADSFFAKFAYRFSGLRPLLDKFRLSPVEIEALSFNWLCFPRLLFSSGDILFPVSGIWGAIICRIIRFIKKTPFVYSSQGGIEPLIAGQKPDIYFSVWPNIKVWLNKHFPNLRVVYISNGVDLKRFRPAGPKVDLGISKPVIMTVSALFPQKQADLTLKAVSKLKNGSLLILGDGPLKADLLKIGQKLILKNRLKILSVPQNQIHKYYRSADVFAFSAPWELGWSIVHLEALASGLPVVANFNPELRRLIQATKGVVCDVKNINQYAKSIELALKIKDRSQPAGIKQFDWDRIARKYSMELSRLTA